MINRFLLVDVFAPWLASAQMLAQGATSQTARDRSCTALNRAERSIVLVALDSVFDARAIDAFSVGSGLRLWKTVDRSPFRVDGMLSPPVDLIRQYDVSFLRRR